MKKLIRHLLQENEEEIVAKSFLNCHVEGLHSIMLLNSPSKTIRLYITDTNHKLTTNNLAIHPHHCNVTLHQIYGNMINCNYAVEQGGIVYNKFEFSSGITGSLGFKKIGTEKLKLEKAYVLSPGDCVTLPAETLHTVECAKDKVSAWFVYEGRENPEYKPLCYSTKDEIVTDKNLLYIKTDIQKIKSLLISIGMY